MGYLRSKYEREHREKFTQKGTSHFPCLDKQGFRSFLEGSVILEDYSFPPHFFDQYRERVEDSRVGSMSDREIADLVVHSINETLSLGEVDSLRNTNLLVRLHRHEDQSEVELGTYHFPIDRDKKLDPTGKRIVVKTIMGAEERIAKVFSKLAYLARSN
jgi:hypothetical protein